MRSVIGITFFVATLACGAVMYYWYAQALIDWLGVIFGILVAVCIIPGAVIFPLVFWIVEGYLPIAYVTVWVLGVVCTISAGVLLQRENSN